MLKPRIHAERNVLDEEWPADRWLWFVNCSHGCGFYSWAGAVTHVRYGYRNELWARSC